MARRGKNGSLTDMENYVALMNNYTYNYFLERMMNVKTSLIGWKNLPESMDERFIEWVLMINGIGVGFRYNADTMGGSDFSKDGDLVFMKSAIGGNFDIYNVPKIRNAYAVNGVNAQLDYYNSAICFNNMTRTKEMANMFMFANRLAATVRVRDMNIDSQRMSGVFICEESERLTMANFFKSFWNYMPFTVARKRKAKMQDPFPVEAIRPDIPIVFDKLTDVSHDVWNEFLTWSGVNNSNIDKRERVNTKEVDANNDEIWSARNSRLTPRKQFAERFNKLFDENIEPYWKTEEELKPELSIEVPEGSEEDESHDNNDL